MLKRKGMLLYKHPYLKLNDIFIQMEDSSSTLSFGIWKYLVYLDHLVDTWKNTLLCIKN